MLRGTVTETLGTRLASRDAARFVGRERELAVLEPLLEADPPVSIVLLHGPGGVGKSALMREFARRSAARGRMGLLIDARDLAPLVEAVGEALRPAMTARRPLVLRHSWERLSGLDS